MILSFWSENEEGDDLLESGGGGWLAALFSVRAELARGDLRALYLGWLLCLQNGELDRYDRWPRAPTGLRTLSASLSALVDFLRIDLDLVRVSAKRAATGRTVGDIPLRQRGSAATGGTARSRRARALRVTR